MHRSWLAPLTESTAMQADPLFALEKTFKALTRCRQGLEAYHLCIREFGVRKQGELAPVSADIDDGANTLPLEGAQMFNARADTQPQSTPA